MELLLNNYQGLPKGFNGTEWNTSSNKIPRRKDMVSYLRQDLPKQNCRKLRQKFAKSSFTIMPKIDYFEQFIATQYHKKRCRDNYKKKKRLNQTQYQGATFLQSNQQICKDTSQQINNINSQEFQVQQNCFDKLTTIKNQQSSLFQNKKQIIRQINRQKRILINDIGYLKLFSDKHSNVKIECLQKLQEYNNITQLLEDVDNEIIGNNKQNSQLINQQIPINTININQPILSQLNNTEEFLLNNSATIKMANNNVQQIPANNNLIQSGITSKPIRQTISAFEGSRGRMRYQTAQSNKTSKEYKTQYNNLFISSMQNDKQNKNQLNNSMGENYYNPQVNNINKINKGSKQEQQIIQQQAQQEQSYDEDDDQSQYLLKLQKRLDMQEQLKQKKIRINNIYYSTLSRKLGIIKQRENTSQSKNRESYASNNNKSFEI